MDIEYFQTVDACITDACEFLKASRLEFFQAASEWSQHIGQFEQFAQPEDFYRSFEGDRGQANLCCNILDQFTRVDLWGLLSTIFKQNSHIEWHYMDFGCGTGALSFPFCGDAAAAYFVDLPNLAQQFLQWRVQQYGLHHVIVADPQQIMDVRTNLMICIDVLEHVAESTTLFERLDSYLAVDGLLLFRAPWASQAPHPEHLPAAEADWYRAGGGDDQLKARYERLVSVPFGGLYRKAAPASGLPLDNRAFKPQETES